MTAIEAVQFRGHGQKLDPKEGGWPTFTFFVKVGTTRSAGRIFFPRESQSVERGKKRKSRRRLHGFPPLQRAQRWASHPHTPAIPTASALLPDDIFVCALAGGLNPMPISPQQPETTTLIDSFSQKWCAGASVSNSWGSACQGGQVQAGTMKRYLDHGDVTVP